jgi:hypothetical protein
VRLNQVGHQCGQWRGVEHTTVCGHFPLPLRRGRVCHVESNPFLRFDIKGDDDFAVRAVFNMR